MGITTLTTTPLADANPALAKAVPVKAAALQSPGPAANAAVDQTCRLIQGPVALSAQLVLLVVVVCALTFKRHRERPRRAMNVWLLDIGKQACSAGAGHTVGLLIAILVHSRYPKGASECGWYFVVYFMDATLGLTLAITFHKITTGTARWLQRRHIASGKHETHDPPWHEALVEIGHYGDASAPSIRRWFIQVTFWVLCVITARTVVGATILSLAQVFQGLTMYLDRRFAGRPHVYLYTVMVGIPMVINIGQAWIQDQVLKWKAKVGKRNDDDLEERQVLESAEGGIVTSLLAPQVARASGRDTR